VGLPDRFQTTHRIRIAEAILHGDPAADMCRRSNVRPRDPAALFFFGIVILARATPISA
jgi:hypothetical protein